MRKFGTVVIFQILIWLKNKDYGNMKYLAFSYLSCVYFYSNDII